jgi:hypothetical protein
VIIYRNYSRFYQVSFENCVTFVYNDNICSFIATFTDFTGLNALVKEEIEQCVVSDLPYLAAALAQKNTEGRRNRLSLPFMQHTGILKAGCMMSDDCTEYYLDPVDRLPEPS